jgi:serine/threonine protein kinase
MGAVLYTALSGKEPFSGETLQETLENVLTKSLPPPSAVGTRPPSCFDWVCMKALARDPRDRFESAEAMAAELRRVAIREELLAAPSEVARWVKRTLATMLESRRLALLDASRHLRQTPSAGAIRLASAERKPTATHRPDDLPEPVSSQRSSKPPEGNVRPAKRPHDYSRTLVLEQPAAPRWRNRIVYAALGLAAVAIAVVSIWPERVAGLFRMTPEVHYPKSTILEPASGSASHGEGAGKEQARP